MKSFAVCVLMRHNSKCIKYSSISHTKGNQCFYRRKSYAKSKYSYTTKQSAGIAGGRCGVRQLWHYQYAHVCSPYLLLNYYWTD